MPAKDQSPIMARRSSNADHEVPAKSLPALQGPAGPTLPTPLPFSPSAMAPQQGGGVKGLALVTSLLTDHHSSLGDQPNQKLYQKTDTTWKKFVTILYESESAPYQLLAKKLLNVSEHSKPELPFFSALSAFLLEGDPQETERSFQALDELLKLIVLCNES